MAFTHERQAPKTTARRSDVIVPANACGDC